MDINKLLVKEGEKINLKKISTSDTQDFKSKDEAKAALRKNINKMAELQDKLYAQDQYSMLIIFQAMDAAGKDGTIKHVMSGLNPQGTQVFSFKQPSSEELDHAYLWRINKALPERGRIGIFNRSHYEDVLIVKVHDLLKFQKLPQEFINQKIWDTRYRQINDFEKYLAENGMIILKFFLHVSKEEQKKRFLSRIEDPSKNWKFSSADIKERSYWDNYQKAYEEAISITSKRHSPWYIIPADKKWFARLAVSEVIVKSMKKVNPDYPQLSEKQVDELKQAKEILEKEEKLK